MHLSLTSKTCALCGFLILAAAASPVSAAPPFGDPPGPGPMGPPPPPPRYEAGPAPLPPPPPPHRHHHRYRHDPADAAVIGAAVGIIIAGY